MRKSETCNSLEEVRTCIDQVDGRIIDLLAERSTYVAQAVRFKPTAGEIPAPDRVRDVITRVRQRAQSVGLDPGIAESTYRALIGAFIDWEKRLHPEADGTKGG